MENFTLFGLPQGLIQSLKAMNFITPTPIQAQTIPLALEGKDILGSAQTGTGKTGAYTIPMLTHLMAHPSAHALILTPTRELAVQVLETVHQMTGRKSGIYTALLIGGDPMFKQLKQLKHNPRIIVGTPGRINDHLMRGTLSLDNTQFFVLDETDRMLDMGFSVQLQKIAQHLPEKRQTLMFSATMAPSIVKIAQKYLKNEVRIAVGSTTTPTEKITQEVFRITEPKKYDTLVEQLNLYAGSCIVFVKTKSSTEKLAHKLRENGHEADAIHGDLRQRNRERVIKGFRHGKYRILVATDIAARGLDIPDIECVINYDLPQCPEDFIHRIGRTGRAGADGRAISLVTSQDSMKWKSICRLINPKDQSAADDEADRAFARNNRRRGNGGNGGGFRNSRSGGFRGRSFSRRRNDDGAEQFNSNHERTEGGFANRSDRSNRRSSEENQGNFRANRGPRRSRFGGNGNGNQNNSGNNHRSRNSHGSKPSSRDSWF